MDESMSTANPVIIKAHDGYLFALIKPTLSSKVLPQSSSIFSFFSLSTYPINPSFSMKLDILYLEWIIAISDYTLASDHWSKKLLCLHNQFSRRLLSQLMLLKFLTLVKFLKKTLITYSGRDMIMLSRIGFTHPFHRVIWISLSINKHLRIIGILLVKHSIMILRDVWWIYGGDYSLWWKVICHLSNALAQ